MAAGELRSHLERRGIEAMAPSLAISALDLALASGDVNVTVAAVDWSRFAPAYASTRERPLLGELTAPLIVDTDEPDASNVDLCAELRPLTPIEREDRILDMVLDTTATVLGFADGSSLDPDAGFSALGLDSLMAVQLRERLQRLTSLALPSTLAFDHPTPTHVTALLMTRLAEQLDQPNAAVSGAGQQVAGSSGADVRVRAALDQIPVEVLEQSGVLAALLELANKVAESQRADVFAEEKGGLDQLSDDDLLSAANALLGDLGQ